MTREELAAWLQLVQADGIGPDSARRLLAEGSALSEAAYAMGFADQAHLQRAFKAHHSMTPGCYARGA